MKLLLETLRVKTRKGIFEIPFSKKITYYYGQSSVGKSTILRLIDWCLGEENIEKTAEIVDQFLGAKLSIILEEKKITLEREFGENEIVIEFTEDNEELSRKIPIKQKDYPIIPNTQIYTISDFLFHYGGLKPPHIKRSQLDSESGLERISFRDIMWYCYLKQEEMVSSLFYLESPDNYFKHKKSRETLRYLLEYNVDQVAELQVRLSELQEKRAGEENTIQELSKFLTEQNIENIEHLQTQRNDLIKEIEKLSNELVNVQNSLKSKNYDMVLELRKKRQSLLVYLEKIEEESNNVEKRLEQHEELRGEYVSANTKIIRTYSARDFFKDLEFQICPKCGQKLEHEIEHDHCMLCKQSSDEKTVFNARKTDIDFTNRIKELDDWIKRLDNEKLKLIQKQDKTLKEKYRIDVELDELSRASDSQYLANAKTIEQHKYRLESKVEFIDKVLPMVQKVSNLKQNVIKLDENIKEIKIKIKDEMEQIRQTNKNLSELANIFKDVLLRVHFQDFNEQDGVIIDPFTLFPRIIKSGTKIKTLIDFNNMGSAGRKNIFKSCYAIAIHLLSEKINGRLPTLLIIDTPMQHINEELDEPLFRSYYNFIYEIVNNELKNHQLILVDKKDFRGVTELKLNQLNFKEPSSDDITIRLLSKDDPSYPPLF